MTRSEALSIVRAIAAPQRGLFTRHQARVAGINDMWLARMKDDELEQVQHGVWSLADAPDDRHRGSRAAILMLDSAGTSFVKSLRQPACVISHLTAAVIHGMCEQLPARKQRPVVTTADKISTTQRVQPIHGRLAPTDVVWIDAMPVTSAERTVADLLPSGFANIRLGNPTSERQFSRPTGT